MAKTLEAGVVVKELQKEGAPKSKQRDTKQGGTALSAKLTSFRYENAPANLLD
jgi:hypothetical protein